MREGVFSSRRFWIGFATVWAVLIGVYAVVAFFLA